MNIKKFFPDMKISEGSRGITGTFTASNSASIDDLKKKYYGKSDIKTIEQDKSIEGPTKG